MDAVAFCKQFLTTGQGLAYLRDRGILKRNPPNCTRNDCRRFMREVVRSDTIDGVVWRCPSHKGCKTAVRCGSILENRKLSIAQFCTLAYTWALGIQPSIQETMCGVSNTTVIEWNQYFRDVCSRWLLDHPIRLGGPGCVVEIDESVLAPDRWVFAMYDVGQRTGIFEIVDDRSQDTLLRIIERHVRPGSLIYSDGWAEYDFGAILAIPVIPPYEHQVVNHTENTCACTDHVKIFLKNTKAKIKNINKTQKGVLPSHLEEFMWRQFHGKKTYESYENLLLHIKEQSV